MLGVLNSKVGCTGLATRDGASRGWDCPCRTNLANPPQGGLHMEHFEEQLRALLKEAESLGIRDEATKLVAQQFELEKLGWQAESEEPTGPEAKESRPQPR